MSLLSEPLGTVHGEAMAIEQTKSGRIAVSRRTMVETTRNSWAEPCTVDASGAHDPRRSMRHPILSVTAKGGENHEPRRAAQSKPTRALARRPQKRCKGSVFLRVRLRDLRAVRMWWSCSVYSDAILRRNQPHRMPFHAMSRITTWWKWQDR